MNNHIRRVYRDGKRFYEISEKGKVLAVLPSVTTIQGSMSDKSGLDAWKKRVGEEEANRISQLSLNRGTAMHRIIELYKPLGGTPAEKKSNVAKICTVDEEMLEIANKVNGDLYIKEAWKFFDKFWNNQDLFLGRVQDVLESERFIWTIKGGRYAGTLDNVSKMKDGKVLIIDYKNSRKPKRDEWIEDYFRQIAAYWVAYWDRTGIKTDGAEIWIANEIDDIPQNFTLTQSDLKYYYKSFLKIRQSFGNKFKI